MEIDKYKMSFSTGGLFLKESVDFARLYEKIENWQEVREKAVNDNVLQTRTHSSTMRTSREICQRLSELKSDELQLFLDGDNQERTHLLWLAICRRYRFIYEFAVEVVRERYLTLRNDVGYEDFDSFFNAKMDWHEELEKITSMTRDKLRQILFRIMHEAEILNVDNLIIPAVLSFRTLEVIRQHSELDLQVFPVSDADLQGGEA